jgi:hypothetical protein
VEHGSVPEFSNVASVLLIASLIIENLFLILMNGVDQ